MERKNKDKNPVYYKNAEEMDKPLSVLIEELRTEISRTRGKINDIRRSYGWDERLEIFEGGLTCIISAMYGTMKEIEDFEKRAKVKTEA
jgi:hypothetical protein